MIAGKMRRIECWMVTPSALPGLSAFKLSGFRALSLSASAPLHYSDRNATTGSTRNAFLTGQ